VTVDSPQPQAVRVSVMAHSLEEATGEVATRRIRCGA